MGFYTHSSFFQFGPPITFMGKTIEDDITYYYLLLVIFFHQTINNLINEVSYPWIINTVQNPLNKQTGYSNKISLLIVNLFSLYSEIDVILILSGMMTQITFFFVIILSNFITLSYINWNYLKTKKSESSPHQIDLLV